ncbi:MAG: hypothetical protein ABIU87_03600 [Ornithinibacter sp.]
MLHSMAGHFAPFGFERSYLAEVEAHLTEVSATGAAEVLDSGGEGRCDTTGSGQRCIGASSPRPSALGHRHGLVLTSCGPESEPFR